MRHALLALGAATLIAAALPSAADAHCDGCGVAAGAIGGLAAGAIIGSAIAGGGPVYVAPAPVYGPPPPPAYYDDDDDGPVCHMEHHRVWVDGWGWRWRRVEVCD